MGWKMKSLGMLGNNESEDVTLEDFQELSRTLCMNLQRALLFLYGYLKLENNLVQIGINYIMVKNTNLEFIRIRST